MSDSVDIAPYVKDPSLLVDLCREVIDGLDSSTDDSDVGEREAQLREISKTIERFEKAGVSVPDVLRGEKTRLAASLAVHADSTQALGQLADEFANIVKELRTRLGQGQTAPTSKAKGKRSRAPKTDKNVLREHIIGALRKLSAGEKEVFAVSLLWGLAQASELKLPIIIDTPLSRLDSTHRDNIVNNYFPNAGEQVVILSTDTEIDTDYYRSLKPRLSGAASLEFDQRQELTTFRQGYFWENNNG